MRRGENTFHKGLWELKIVNPFSWLRYVAGVWVMEGVGNTHNCLVPGQSMTCRNSEMMQSDMQPHWQQNRLQVCFSLFSNQMHKSNEAAALVVTPLLRPLLTLTLKWHAEIMKREKYKSKVFPYRWDLLVSLGKMSQCASDESAAITRLCTICRSALKLYCSAVCT